MKHTLSRKLSPRAKKTILRHPGQVVKALVHVSRIPDPPAFEEAIRELGGTLRSWRDELLVSIEVPAAVLQDLAERSEVRYLETDERFGVEEQATPPPYAPGTRYGLVRRDNLRGSGGPCIFTARAAHGAAVLAYLSEDLKDEQRLRYIVATTSEETVDELKHGVTSVREALDRGSLWVVDFDYGYRPVRAFSVRSEQLPEDAMPLRGTMLWSSLEPARKHPHNQIGDTPRGASNPEE